MMVQDTADSSAAFQEYHPYPYYPFPYIVSISRSRSRSVEASGHQRPIGFGASLGGESAEGRGHEEHPPEVVGGLLMLMIMVDI